MPVLIVSDPETGTSQKVEIEDRRMSPLIGRRIGEVLDGTLANLPGHKIQLTGGCDKDGVPMRPDVHGGAKAQVVLSSGVGFRPRDSGERRRKTVRGNTVNVDTIFLNFKIVEKPKRQSKKKAEEKREVETSSE